MPRKNSSSKTKSSRSQTDHFKHTTAFFACLSFLLVLTNIFFAFIYFEKSKETQKLLSETETLKSFMTELDIQLKICQGDIQSINSDLEAMHDQLGNQPPTTIEGTF